MLLKSEVISVFSFEKNKERLLDFNYQRPEFSKSDQEKKATKSKLQNCFKAIKL